MKTLFMNLTGLVALTLIGSAASAQSKAVEACTLDKYTSERIQEIPADQREPVLAIRSDDVVGAVQFEPSTGEIVALYLCGRNSGSYYAEGNVHEGRLDSFYNDEYESEFKTALEDFYTEVYVKSVKFIGEPEDADYPEFSTAFRFKFSN